MAHTKRELLYTVAEQVGGEHGERLRAMLAKSSLIDDLLDRPISEAEYATQLTQLVTDLPRFMAQRKRGHWDKPGTWGLSN